MPVFWDVTPCFSGKTRRFGGTYRLNHQGRKNNELGTVLQLLLTAKVIRSSLIHSTLMMEPIRSSEPSVLTGTTQRDIPEDGLLHSHHRENLNSYVALTGWALYRRRNMFPLRYELVFLTQKTAFFIVIAVKASNLT
jgi:hypothetical protein